jgi:ABC-2 type transport system ATP-binding protein
VTAAIETSGLGKTYGPTRAVTGLDLVVQPGQVFAFLGPNGAGKTTTIRMLLALQGPTRAAPQSSGLTAPGTAWRSTGGPGTCPGTWRCTRG